MTYPSAIRAVFASLAFCTVSAQASLVTLSGSGWPPAGSTGLEAVQFKVGTAASGLQVALGAHADTESATLANNGVDTFFAARGLSPTAGANQSRWALDYAIDYGTGSVSDYVTRFWFDTDPSVDTRFSVVLLDASNCTSLCGAQVLAGSINASTLFQQLLAQGSNFTLDPFAEGNFTFRLDVLKPNERAPLATTQINVLAVPEPASAALVAVGLAAALCVRRKRRGRAS